MVSWRVWGSSTITPMAVPPLSVIGSTLIIWLFHRCALPASEARLPPSENKHNQGGRHAGASRASDCTDHQSAQDRVRRHSGRYAGFLRLLSDRLRAGIHRRSMATDLRSVGDDTAGGGTGRGAWSVVLGLACRSHRA